MKPPQTEEELKALLDIAAASAWSQFQENILKDVEMPDEAKLFIQKTFIEGFSRGVRFFAAYTAQLMLQQKMSETIQQVKESKSKKEKPDKKSKTKPNFKKFLENLGEHPENN